MYDSRPMNAALVLKSTKKKTPAMGRGESQVSGSRGFRTQVIGTAAASRRLRFVRATGDAHGKTRQEAR
jgi:hypothetical protein